jgi:MoxR-like ATPase
MVNRYVALGSSPRGAQALLLAGKVRALLAGRFAVATDDIRAVAPAALRHRVLLSFEGRAERIDADAVVQAALDAVPELSEAR